MGRFYRTAAARPGDYMHRINTPLMEKVLSANEAYINTNLALADKFSQFDYEHIDKDDPVAQRLIKEYNDYGEAVTSGIMENPANWREKVPQLKYLQSKLLKDYKTGTIGKQIANYNARKAAFEEVDTQEKLYNTSGGEKGINPHAAAAYKAYWDKNFAGTGEAETGYNVYRGGNAMADINFQKILNEGLDKIKADKTYEYREDEYGQGWYKNKVTNKEERLTNDKVLEVVSDKITPGMIQYLRERQDIGELSGAFDEEGKFIAPYEYIKPGISTDQQAEIDKAQKEINDFKGTAEDKKAMQQTLDDEVTKLKNREVLKWQEGHPLTGPLRGLSNQYAYSDIESGNVLSNAQKGLAYYNAAQAKDRQNTALRMQYLMHTEKLTQANQQFEDTQAWKKYTFEHPQAKAGTGTTGIAGIAPEKPVETGVSAFATRSFEGLQTPAIDKKTGLPRVDENGHAIMVKTISNEGVASAIQLTKAEQDKTNKRLTEINADLNDGSTTIKEAEALTAEKQGLEVASRKLESDLGMYRSWYNTAEDVVLSNRTDITGVALTNDEKALYTKQMKDDPNGKKLWDNFQAVRKAHPDTVEYQSTKVEGAKPTAVYVYSPEAKAALDQYNHWMGVKNKVLSGKDKYYGQIRSDVVDNDAIHLNTVDSEDVGKMLMANTQGMKLFDSFGKPTTKEINNAFLGLGKTYALGFEGENELNLPGYIKAHNGDVSLTVEDIGTTTNMGSGHAMAKVRITDNTGEIPDGVYYVELNDGVQAAVADKFSKSSNPTIANIAKSIGDGEANGIRNQIIKPSQNRILGRDGEEPNSYSIEVQDRTGRSVPIYVKKIKEGNATKFYMEGVDLQGHRVPFPRIPNTGGTPGRFNGIEDWITAHKYYKGEK